MRKIYLLFCGFLISVCLQSQTIVNKTFHNYNDQAFQLTSIGNDFYFNSNIYTDGYQDFCLVNAIDSIGNTIFRRVITKHEYTKITKVIKTKDGNLCVIGFASGCDFLNASQSTFVIKLDKVTGLSIFDNTFSNLDANYQNDFLKDIVQYEDSTYFAITDSLLFHFSKDGNTLGRINTGLSGLISLSLRGDGKLFLTSSSQFPLTKFTAIIDTSGTIANQYPLNDFAYKTLYVDSNSIYTLNKVIAKRNATMQIVSNSAASQDSLSGNIISDFTLTNDTIYACGYNLLASNSFVLLLDTNLNLIEIKVNETSRVKPVSISYKKKISILINSNSYPAQNGIIGVYSFNKSEDYVFSEDIGVTEIMMDSGYVTYNTVFNPPSGPNLYQLSNRYYKTRVVVKNYGMGIINQLQINQLLTVNSFCGYVYYTKPFDSLNILPGISDTLDLGWVHQSESPNPVSTLPSTMDLSVCLNTSIPNQKHDKNSNNDGACANITLQVVGSKEMKEEINLNLFPNPVNNLLSIKTDAFIERINIQDIAGRCIEQKEIDRVQKFEISVGNLEPGIYFIEIKTTKGVVVRKIIKQ